MDDGIREVWFFREDMVYLEQDPDPFRIRIILKGKGRTCVLYDYAWSPLLSVKYAGAKARAEQGAIFILLTLEISSRKGIRAADFTEEQEISIVEEAGTPICCVQAVERKMSDGTVKNLKHYPIKMYPDGARSPYGHPVIHRGIERKRHTE